MIIREDVTLEDRYARTSGTVMMSGIQALIRTTLDQRRLDSARGLNTGVLVSGYQGSPLGGIDREMDRGRAQLEPQNIRFLQGLNEELGATTIAGTQLIGQVDEASVDGVVGIWFGKNPGLDRAADAIRHANISGTSPTGGAVAWIGDDPASKSSTVPSSCEAMCRSLLMPLLAPGSVSEVLELGLHAVAMSRYSGLWTGLKIVADVADSSATVDLSEPSLSIPSLPERAPTPAPVMLPPTNLDAEADAMTTRLERALEYGRAANLNKVTHDPPNPRTTFMAAGMAYQALLRALSDLGLRAGDLDRLGIRLVQIGMPWPLDADAVRGFCADVDRVIVVEDKLGFIESLVRDALYRLPHQPEVLGKNDGANKPLFSTRSTLTSDDLVHALRRIYPGDLAGVRTEVGATRTRTHLKMLAQRTPSFCSGCPHSVSTRAADDQLVGVGIGCHIMVALEGTGKRGQLLGMPQMGGEGAQWLGIQPFAERTHFTQNLGDGTFYHSGSLALRAAVAADVDITYKLLFNDTVAMTGGQHPQGQMGIPELTRWLELEGVRKVIITTRYPKAWRRARLSKIARVVHRDHSDKAQRELAATAGVTVLLHIDRCATEERRLRKRGRIEQPDERVWINERVCEGCGDCGDKSTCLSVQPVDTAYGRKTRIHQSSCNQDASCLKGDCPSFVVVTSSGTSPVQQMPDLQASMPEPRRLVPSECSIRMPGVGGTGVVTISKVLQMAAHLQGDYAAGLEQTGLAQKGGPVISDVRFAAEPIEGQLKAGRGTAAALIAFDALGAAERTILDTLAPGAVAVVNTASVPTAQMVQDVTATRTDWGHIRSRVEEVTEAADNLYIDALELAQRFFNDHMPANMVLAGAAYQHGALPLDADSIEAAIRINGAAVDKNIAAFRIGRLAVARPEAVSRTPLPPPVIDIDHDVSERVSATSLGPIVSELVGQRATDLVAYQDSAYAERYVAQVDSVSHRGTAITEAFAVGLYKLMAYKDEYEVARLHLDTFERARMASEFGQDATFKIMLLPPALRALGRRRKIALGPWILPVLETLHRLRRLRGTRLDPFGRAHVRQVERSLIEEYTTLIMELDRVGADDATMLRACKLADGVRGYEHVKLSNVEEFRARASAILTETGADPTTAHQRTVSA